MVAVRPGLELAWSAFRACRKTDIRAARKALKTGITATQMLESMIEARPAHPGRGQRQCQSIWDGTTPCAERGKRPAPTPWKRSSGWPASPLRRMPT